MRFKPKKVEGVHDKIALIIQERSGLYVGTFLNGCYRLY